MIEKNGSKHILRNGINAAFNYYMYLGWAAVILMSITVTIDVIGRYAFNKPLRGGPEIVEQLMVCTIYFLIPYVTKENRHIAVDIFISAMSKAAPRIHWVTNFILDFIILVLLAHLAYEGFVGTIAAVHSREVTTTLRIPHWPFHFILAVGFTLALVSFFMRLADNLMAKLRGQ